MPAIGRLWPAAAVLLLVACAAAPARRDGGVRIASVMAFEAARFAGPWLVVASHTPGCEGAAMVWVTAPGGFAQGGFTLDGTDCTGAAPAPLAGRARLVGPGARIETAGAFGGDPVWVLWVDQGYRVAALGTPSGRWAMIIARPGAARADLLAAAREVLAFNGYDLAQLAASR